MVRIDTYSKNVALRHLLTARRIFPLEHVMRQVQMTLFKLVNTDWIRYRENPYYH